MCESPAAARSAALRGSARMRPRPPTFQLSTFNFQLSTLSLTFSEPMNLPRALLKLPDSTAVALVTVLYYAAARVGLLLAFADSNASPVWPPSGLALAAVLLLGPRVWPGIFVGAFAANFAVFSGNLTTSLGTLGAVSGAIAAGNTLEALAGAWLFRRWFGTGNALKDGAAVLRFVGVAALMCAVSAGLGSVSLLVSGVIPSAIWGTVALTWWIGDVAGVLILTPALLGLAGGSDLQVCARRRRETAGLLLALILVAAVPFGGWLPRGLDQALMFLLFPAFLWPVFRLSQRAAAGAVVCVSFMAIGQTVNGAGPFSRDSLNESLLLLQGFVCVIAITIHALAAALAERRRFAAALMVSEDRLRKVTETLPQLIWTCLPDGRCDYLGPQWVAYTGIPEAQQLGYGWVEQLHPEDRAHTTARWAETAAVGQDLDVEFRIRRHDGVYRWFKTRAVPLRDPAGAILKWFGSNTDIEELRLAEKELRQLNATLEQRVAERTAELNQTVVALQREVSERNRMGQLLAWEKKALERLASAASLPEVLNALVLGLEAQAPGALCSVLLLDADGIHLRHGTAPSLPAAYNQLIDGVAIGPAVGSCGTAAFANRQVIVADIASDPLWANYKSLALAHGLRACWSTPITSSAGKVLGTFAIYYREPRQPTPAELELISRAQRLVGLAIEHKQAEAAQRVSDRAIKAISQGVLIAGPDTKILSANSAFLAITGYAEAEVLGRTCGFVQGPGSDPQTVEAIRLAKHNHQEFSGEILNYRKDGTPFWNELTISPILDLGSGTLTHFIGITRDITARKEAEDALAASERRLRTIFETEPECVKLLAADGSLLEMNPAGLRLIEADSFQQVASLCVYPLVVAKDRPAFQALNEQVFAGASGTLEFQLTGLKGGCRWLETHASPLRDATGQIVAQLAITRDITARKEAEAALRESRERFELAVRGAVDGIWDWNVVTGEDYFSDRWCELLGYAPGELKPVADTWVGLLHPDDKERTLAAVQVHFEQRTPFDIEYRLRTKGGEYLWVRAGGQARWDAAGKPVRMAGSITDITVRKRIETELEQLNSDLQRSNQELEQFAYVASHDLQEPLRAVAGCVQILRNRYQDKLDARADELIRHSVEGAERMQTLIADLLAFSSVGTQGTKPVPLESGAALGTALVNLRTALTESGATVTHDPLPSVVGDRTQLTQLFQNLVGNALKYRSPARPPAIHVSAEPEGEQWRFAVQDNGIGIEPQYFERIFVIFQRLHTRAEYPGTGIGLALCKKIVERHGGRLWLESQPGEGTVFYFTLSAPA